MSSYAVSIWAQHMLHNPKRQAPRSRQDILAIMRHIQVDESQSNRSHPTNVRQAQAVQRIEEIIFKSKNHPCGSK